MAEIEKKLENINKNIMVLSNISEGVKEDEKDNINLYSFFASKTKDTLVGILQEFKEIFLNLNSKPVSNITYLLLFKERFILSIITIILPFIV